EIASGFHFQFWGSSCIEPTIGKRQRKSSCLPSVIASPSGRGNPVGFVAWAAETMRWVAQWFRWIAASLSLLQ
ncbi:MAG: hypothetical protein VCA18_04195, partial [Opitutales bacterium]